MGSSPDQDAVTSTVLDYFEGWFDGDVARMERALHPDLCKRALRLDRSVMVINAQQMIDDTGKGDGKCGRPADLNIRVTVEDVYADMANATVYSTVYTEYLQLVRMPDGWKILNALWTSVP